MRERSPNFRIIVHRRLWKLGKILADMTPLDSAIAASRRAFAEFTARCRNGETEYRLTPAAEPSPYARCFGVFCSHLAGEPLTSGMKRALAGEIRRDVRSIASQNIDRRGKGFRQLVTFSLSALAALGAVADDPLEEIVAEQIPADVKADLDRYDSLNGVPGSGNQAMFTAIFLIHARDHLGRDTDARIQEWVTLHLSRMNRFGFWGSGAGMTHLQFQNGYHQYEILEYLGVANPRELEAVTSVRGLADPYGQFAPYPGGGGCYDYDAVFVLTPRGEAPDERTRHSLELTARTLLGAQRTDGGFAESLYVRPRSSGTLARTIRHIARSGGSIPLFTERLRYGLALQRPKHDRIHTHWSKYSRRWDESDLWDSWFRMMALARIQVGLDGEKNRDWRFIDYPGIGYHPRARHTSPAA